MNLLDILKINVRHSKNFLSRQIVLIKELPFAPISNRKELTEGRNQNIPKVVYQTFKENSFGKTHLKEIQKFRDINPDLSFKFFDEVNRDRWMEENFTGRTILEVYKCSTLGPSKADIFRYCIIYKLGGYYFDISKGCSLSLTSLHSPDSDGIISFEKNTLYYPPDYEGFKYILHPDKYILQWGFGFVPGHLILKRVIENIEENYINFKGTVFLKPKVGVLMFTATGRFTKVVREVLNEYPEINITQAGIDFYGHGIFEMPGSRARYLLSPAYAELRNKVILK